MSVELCVCGHAQSIHLRSVGECWATSMPDGSAYCSCQCYRPATVPHPAAPGADEGGQES